MVEAAPEKTDYCLSVSVSVSVSASALAGAAVGAFASSGPLGFSEVAVSTGLAGTAGVAVSCGLDGRKISRSPHAKKAATKW